MFSTAVCFVFRNTLSVIAGHLKEEAVVLEMREKEVILELVTGGEIMKGRPKALVERWNEEENSVSKIGTQRSCVHLPKICTSLTQL
jgi:hypothetical protein